MSLTRVSVITSTWQRHEQLLNRCIPSVQAQTHQRLEHVIVSDGPDPVLDKEIEDASISPRYYHPVRWLSLPEHAPEPHWGAPARLAGLRYASGTYIAYLDDDDAYRPEHVAVLAKALDEHPEAGFAYSVMVQHSRVPGHVNPIGDGVPREGQIGTPMIMHRRKILAHGTWGPASATEDWELVERWLNAGISYVHVPEVTVDVWPSAWHSG